MVELILAGICAILLARLASLLWYDPRPFAAGHFVPLVLHANDNGFPSDHTLLSALIGWVVLKYSRRYGVIALFAALVVGTARVIAGVHHPIDIIASFIISGLALVLVVKATQVIYSRRRLT